ncbi:aspartyl protease family protein [uncultured Desulfuromonas sp.]|uniref:retropepsin-like aspartic protease n=1 Tax=uncultured Desulfuromonas sp. TaxID=181013 RepID=UPI002AABB77A|nr:aspartyl protease family protein [uncultured Desulfuromonas sp.]
MKLLVVLLIIGFSALPLAAAEIYHYRNAEGKLIVVDDPELIPPQYSGKKVAAPTSQGITSPQWSQSPAFNIAEPDQEQHTTIQETPVKIYGNQVVVPVALHHRNKDITVHLVLDTGATITLLDRDAVDKLRLKKWRSSTGHLANGTKVEIELARLDQLNVGPLQIEKLKVALIEREKRSRFADGLLGMDVLKHRAYHIDYRNKRLIWQ